MGPGDTYLGNLNNSRYNQQQTEGWENKQPELKTGNSEENKIKPDSLCEYDNPLFLSLID